MATQHDTGMGRQGTFPVDRPTDALRHDHEMVRHLADKYLNSDSAEVKKQAATQILQALHMHSRLEESVFYPAVRDTDPALVGHFEQEHLHTDDLVATLQGMSLDDAHSEQLMRELLGATLSHIEEEESKLFPRLEQSGRDMAQLGLQMQSFEANLVHTQAQLSDTQVRRR